MDSQRRQMVTEVPSSRHTLTIAAADPRFDGRLWYLRPNGDLDCFNLFRSKFRHEIKVIDINQQLRRFVRWPWLLQSSTHGVGATTPMRGAPPLGRLDAGPLQRTPCLLSRSTDSVIEAVCAASNRTITVVLG